MCIISMVQVTPPNFASIINFSAETVTYSILAITVVPIVASVCTHLTTSDDTKNRHIGG